MYYSCHFRLNLINIFLITTIILFSILSVSTNILISFSQKVILPSIHQVQNNSIVITPQLEIEAKKTYITKYAQYSIKPFVHKLLPINNTLSFTITNATITAIEKPENGITKIESNLFNQLDVTTSKKMLKGKTYNYK